MSQCKHGKPKFAYCVECCREIQAGVANDSRSATCSAHSHVREALLSAKDLCDKINNTSEFFCLAGFVSDLVDMALDEPPPNDALLLSCDDWVALYVGNNIVTQGHRIEPLELLELAEKHGFSSASITAHFAVEEDIEYAELYGAFTDTRDALCGRYEPKS